MTLLIDSDCESHRVVCKNAKKMKNSTRIRGKVVLILCFLAQLNKYLCLMFYNADDSQVLNLSPNHTEPISIIRSNKNVEFSLVSVHSQIGNITLSYDDPKTQNYKLRRNRFITGLNLGLIVFFDDKNRNYLYLRNENNLELRVYIRILQYDGSYPIPGGCNLEFPINISPFLKLKTTELNLMLEFQKASLGPNFRLIKNKLDCDFSSNKLTYDVYSYYLKENDYSEREYLQALRRMSTVDSIETYGTKLVMNEISRPKTRINIIAYQGRGVVFNVIVTFLNYKTAYSPVATYDCDLYDSNSCKSSQSWSEFISILIVGLLGLIICLEGGKNRVFEIIYFAFLSGSTITYIVVSKFPQITLLNHNLTILLGGLLLSFLCWLFIWFKCPSSTVALILSGIPFGFLITSLILSIHTLGIYQIKHSLTYGILVTFGLMIIPVFSLFIENNKLNTFTCLIFGSYTFVIAIEQLFGGSMIYIILNTINTFIYDDLYLMESNLPFQAIDYFSSILWVFLICLSIFLNLIVDCNLNLTNSLLAALRSVLSLKNFIKFFRRNNESKKYEEIETIDNREEDISKYNELSRSILGSLNNLDKENEIGNTSFNSNSKYSSPLIKRKIGANSSSTKIDFPSTPTSRCSTPSRCSTTSRPNQLIDSLDFPNQSPNLLKNVVIQNARYSASNKMRI